MQTLCWTANCAAAPARWPPGTLLLPARILYTVLEYRNRLDWMLRRFVKKPLTRLDAPVRAILRAGLAQAACMAVPLPAAVNESVKLTRAFGKSSAAGMVNAVLRRTAALQPTGRPFPTGTAGW